MAEANGIYKIFTREEWEAFRETGVFEGSADDRRDGFIHLSTGAQLAETRSRHFGHVADVVVAEVVVRNDEYLKWEKSRRGEAFPHLYRALRRSDVADQHLFRVAGLPG